MGAVLSQAMRSSMPAVRGPQAVCCAPETASFTVPARAVAQLVRPRNATHTRQVWVARAVVR